jgi:hypothetical protein
MAAAYINTILYLLRPKLFLKIKFIRHAAWLLTACLPTLLFGAGINWHSIN